MDIGSINNVLVIGAHFDDAELGCGGTMARLVAENKKVYKLTLTNNETNFTQRNIKVDFEDSKRDSLAASEVLGVEEIEDFDFVTCNQLKYSTELMQQIEKIIFDKQIDTVFIHFDSDTNQDHVEASKLSLTAARHCRNIFYYQSNGYVLEKVFYPTVFFDVSDYIGKKKEALMKYRGDHNRYERLFSISLHRTEIWGYAMEVKNAEGFVPIKLCL